jgi:hypothetical protein
MMTKLLSLGDITVLFDLCLSALVGCFTRLISLVMGGGELSPFSEKSEPLHIPRAPALVQGCVVKS